MRLIFLFLCIIYISSCGYSIEEEKDKTVEECKEVCNNDPECMAFEYGVDYNYPDGDF